MRLDVRMNRRLAACLGVCLAGATLVAAEREREAAPPPREETVKTERASSWWRGLLGGNRRAGAEPVAGATTELTTETIVAGLKAGLGNGVERAVAELGRADGFFANPRFRVPLPPELARGEQALRRLKQDALADELILALNRAAETAVAETGPIFKDALTSMSLADARGILQGPPDAATRYFRDKTEDALRAKMMPIVTAATEANGVGAAYKRFAGRAAPLGNLLGVGALDLDRHVCDRALQGLFEVIAAQEAQLRANPAAAADDLLRRVFGAAGK
jgi:hypothetical protein